MSAISVPVQVDESLIEISSSYSTVRLNQILRHLAHNASVNARVVVTLQHQLEDLRLTVERQTEHTKQQFALEARRRLDLEEALNDERKKLDNLDRTASRKADVDQTFKNFGDKLKMATDFIEEIENGKGERVTKFVSNYIQLFIPEWWGGVSAELMTGIHKLVRETAQTAATNLEKRATECEKKAVFGDQQVQTSCTNSLYGLDGERRKDLSKLRDEMYGRFTNSDHRTDALIESQRAIGEKRYVLVRRRLQTMEESAAALRTTLCLEDELCRELHNLTISQENMRDDSESGDIFDSSSRARSELGVAPRRDVVTDFAGDDDLPGAQRMPDTAEHFKRLSVDETIQDIRVRRVAQTPHLLNMRTLLQREFNDRMEYQKTDLHNDLVAEIFDLQREIRGKVGTNKLGELLDQYRDENLYTNVKLLMQDMTDVKTNKIDSVLFVEALRSKADLRQMELKVDKSILHQQLEGLDRRVDDMTNAVGRHDHRLGRVEHNFLQLQQKKGSVSPTQTLYDTPSMMMIEDGGFRQGGSARNGAQRGQTSPQAKGMRNRGGGSAPNGRVSPPVMVSSPTRRESSASSTFTIPTTTKASKNSASKHQSSQQQVASLVDQIVERGFASQIIVQDQRDMSKLHQTIVKQTHERQVQELLDESAAQQENTSQVDPDVELPALPEAAVRKATHSAQSSSTTVMGRTVSAASARAMSSQSPRQQTVGGSARLNRNASGLVRSSSRNGSSKEEATEASAAGNATQGPGLIPLTSSQEAYCKTLDTQPPPNSGRGISIGLRVGEKRDW